MIKQTQFHESISQIHYTVLHMFTQLLFWAGNQGNHQNFKLIFLKKANPKWPTQKKLVFQFCQFSTCFFFKNFMDWSLVSRIDWCKGHWCESTYMVVRLSNVSSKTGKKCIFWICFSNFFFCFIPLKISQSFLVMGRSFDDYPGFQPKTTAA